MSQWTASDLPPASLCRERVRQCAVYVGILGFEYGTPVRDEPHLSYTELEYEEAGLTGIPRFMFFLAGDPPGAGDHARRQQKFRERVRDEVTVATFENPHHLGELIGRALQRLGRPKPTKTVTKTRRGAFMALPVSDHMVDRTELNDVFEHLRTEADRTRTRGSPDRPAIVALVGPPGFGKSVLADWACHKLRDEFDDILRVELGEEPSEQQLIGWCRTLLRAVGKKCPALKNAVEAGAHLQRILSDRRVLLVVDDLWRRKDLLPFLSNRSSIVLLITTRDRDSLPENAKTILVDQLSEEQTQAILANGIAARNADWSGLVDRTGRWPLLAGLVNGALRGEVQGGRDVDEAVADFTAHLRKHGPAAFDPTNPADRRTAIETTVEVSIARLRKDDGDEGAARYQGLAIFPEGVDVPIKLPPTWRRLTPIDQRRFAQKLLNLSLIQSYDAKAATVRVHDVLRAFLTSRWTPSQRRTAHAEFLDANLPPCWADLPGNAEYLWRWAATHMSEAQRNDELAATVRDVSYLAHKTYFLGTAAVLDDLALVNDARADERRTWFRRWSHLLDGLPQPADIAASLMARPDASAFMNVVHPPIGPPFLRYASGWSCPEPGDTALEGVLGTHQRRVQQCRWSPDGRRLATVDGNGYVQVLTVGDHPEPLELGANEWNVAVAWSPDGRRLAGGDDDGAVHIWWVEGAHHHTILARHDSGVRALAWSLDGEVIASGGDDGVRVWHADSGSARGELHRAGSVRALAWSPAGKRRLACAFDDGDVVLWTPGASGSARVLGRHEGGAFTVCWSNDGMQVTSGGADGIVWKWPVTSGGAPIDLIRRTSAVLALAWSDDGRQLAVGSEDGVLQTVSTKGSAVELGRHHGGAVTVAWEPGRTRLASGGRDGVLRLWRTSDGALGQESNRFDDQLISVAWSADGHRLAGGTRDGVVRVWSVVGGAPNPLSHDGSAVRSVGWSPDSMHLARGLDDGRVRVWSIAAAQDIVDLAATCGSVRSIAWSAAPAASGAMTLGCLADDSTLRIWRIEGATALPVGPVAEWVRAFAWAPDGARILTGTDDGRLQILDLRSAGGAKEIGHRPEHGVRAVAWSPAGDRLASGHDDGAVWLWDPERSDEPIEVGRHADQVRELTWSPDGSQLLSIGADRVLRGWAAVPVDGVGDCALALDGELSALACNPAGDRIAVAGSSPGPHVLEVVVS